MEGHSSDSVCLLGLRRRSGTRLSLLDANSVIQRPSEKLEVPGPHRTDLGLQALLPEIKNGANQESGVLLCEREEMLVSGLGKGEQTITCWDKEGERH